MTILWVPRLPMHACIKTTVCVEISHITQSLHQAEIHVAASSHKDTARNYNFDH